ncbi:preprotein translocase subunit SecE [Frateuria sp. MAH-13]|uniref:Protein translocase subunit SecE n=2 Tax=Frateuria TaxID=70411 RepID=A0ABS4DNT7_9GAMM|nr:preprotein translocase subunit SecE [Frateuria flava]
MSATDPVPMVPFPVTAMNTKAEQPRGTSAADIGKLVLAVLVLAAGIFAYSWFDNTVPGSVRLAGVLVALVVALAIGAFTGPGRKARNFIAESQFEMRKVVWPTRDETLKTTLVIIAVVIVLSLLLGLIDLILKSVVLDWLLKLGS